MSPNFSPPTGRPPTPLSGSGSGSDKGAKTKRARTSKPKVKTGCRNCKDRRIKCDEQRPSCSNCVRSKKICTGYPPPTRSFGEVKILPKLSLANGVPPAREALLQPLPRQLEKYKRREEERKTRAISIRTPPRTPSLIRIPAVLYSTPAALPFNEQEGLYFQLFQEKTASELSGFFDNAFWSRYVLQECHSEAAIRHAVVALGALYKTLEKSCESPPSSPLDISESVPADSPMRHWEMAVKKYSHACQELLLPHSQTTNRTRLMGSVLLACFDSFIGHHKQAIKQIQTGLSLLEELRAERRRAFLPKPEEPVEEELIQMFTRLAIQAKSYDMAFHFPHPWVIHLTTPPQASDPTSPPSDSSSPVSLHHDPIPERFASSIEARLAWDALVERTLRFTETMFSHVANGPMGVLPPSLRRYGSGFKDQIQAWSDAYEHILASRTAPGVSSQEKAAIAALKMTQVMCQILFLMTFSDNEMQFDAFTPQFKGIVDLALEVVGDEERRAAAKRCPDPRLCQHHLDHWVDIFGGHEYAARHIKPSFSADLGIVPPLFVVATKCRDPVIRRQAIQLLRSSARREGMWDSELAARIGIWIAGIEEARETELNTGGGGRFPTSTNKLNFPSPGSGTYEPAPRSFKEEELNKKAIVPPERRVMIKAVEFDLRERFATIQLGTRGLATGAPDLKTKVTRILW